MLFEHYLPGQNAPLIPRSHFGSEQVFLKGEGRIPGDQEHFRDSGEFIDDVFGDSTHNAVLLENAT